MAEKASLNERNKLPLKPTFLEYLDFSKKVVFSNKLLFISYSAWKQSLIKVFSSYSMELSNFCLGYVDQKGGLCVYWKRK